MSTVSADTGRETATPLADGCNNNRLSVQVSRFNSARRHCYASGRVGTKISIIYINDIYHDSIMLENIMIISIFSIFSKYYYLLTYLIHAYLTQTAQVPKLLDGGKILLKI